METLPSDLDQHREASLVMRRPDVLDPHDRAALLMHDLHRPRPRSSRDLPHKRRHQMSLPTPD